MNEKTIRIDDLKIVNKPNCPWNAEESHRLFLQSCEHGHLVLHFKCCSCSLEYDVKTWRTKEDSDCFMFCPECGTKGIPIVLESTQKHGTIFQNLPAS